MKPGIFFKLLVALATTSLAVAITMAILVQWSFRDGFEDFLRQQQLQEMETLASRLAEAYRDDAGWDELSDDPRRWHRLVGQSIGRVLNSPRRAAPPPRPPAGPRPQDEGRGNGPPPRRPGFRPRDRTGDGRPERPPRRFFGRPPGPPPDGGLRLLDSDGNAIFGPPRDQPGELRLPLVVDSLTVGYLARRPTELELDGLATAFAHQQRRNYYLVAGIAVLMSLVVSVLLARALVAPIRRIAKSARQLTAGDYDMPLDLNRRDELGELARDMDQLGAALARNESTRRQWIADISHELRTPLAVLRGETEAILDGVREVSRTRVQSLHTGIMTLAKLVDDLHTLTVSDEGKFSGHHEPVDLVGIMEDALVAYRPRFESNDIALTTELAAPGLAIVDGDARALYQLFTNLAENTNRYTDPGGRCLVRVHCDAHTATIEFSDSSPGVPAETMPRLFERLFRVDRSRSRTHGGSGLGLAICSNIVQMHDGRIGAHASTLGGVSIVVELPRLTEPARENTQ